MIKILKKLVSSILVISFLASVIAVLPVYANEDGDGVTVIYNRGFEEGWDYDNGFSKNYKNELEASLVYKRMSVTWYNYSLKLSAGGNGGGYLTLPIEDAAQDAGKIYFEFDLSVSPENNIGGIVMMGGLGSVNTLTHIVSLSGGNLYLLGQNVGIAPSDFVTVSFEFDFDYARDNGEYKIKAELSDGRSAERVYKTDVLGISALYLGAQENFLEIDRAGDYYLVDNIKVYYGTDSSTALSKDDYGKLVNRELPRTYEILGLTASAADTLKGTPDLERTEYSGESFVDLLTGWASISDTLAIWDYTTNYAHYASTFSNFEVLRKNLKLFADKSKIK